MHTTSRLTWPHLQRFLDEALDLEGGKALLIRSYAGVPLTVNRAETMRQAISKLRKARAAADGTSIYNGLSISAMPHLEHVTLQIFLFDPKSPNSPALYTDHTQLVGKTATSPCFIKASCPNNQLLKVGSPEEPAPEFSSAWRTIRGLLPGQLQITNDYTIAPNQDFIIVSRAPQ